MSSPDNPKILDPAFESRSSAPDTPGEMTHSADAEPATASGPGTELLAKQFETLVPTPDFPSVATEPKHHPQSPAALFRQVRTGLGIDVPQPTSSSLVLSPDEQALEAEILQLWDDHDHCEAKLAPLLYDFCQLLHAPGRKGKGFRRWLKHHHKSHATAYRWIRKYAVREGVPLPFPEKAQRNQPKVQPTGSAAQGSPTLSHMRQASHAHQHDTEEEKPIAEFIAPPESLNELKRITAQYLDSLDDAERRAQLLDLIGWLECQRCSLVTDIAF